MFCPFCLDDVKFKQEKLERQLSTVFLCPSCNEQVPALYAQDYKKYPPVVVSAVGFRQHGKTVYFATLFYTLKKLTLARDWSNFFTMGLNDDSLDTVYDNARMLDTGSLPDSTPKNFPRPTMIRVEGMPIHRDCTLLCFDTGGECFEKPTQLVQFAGFVKRAETGMLLISVADMDDPREEMQKLLNTYIVGMGELGGKTKDQHLVVVFTKADHMAAHLSGQWRYLLDYLLQGSVDNLANPDRAVLSPFVGTAPGLETPLKIILVGSAACTRSAATASFATTSSGGMGRLAPGAPTWEAPRQTSSKGTCSSRTSGRREVPSPVSAPTDHPSFATTSS
ncbi:MAG: hypothetical protein AAF629_24455 [Chloroflexota bacterium]